MKLYIHSSFGVLEAEPLKVQAIEKSISESEHANIEQLYEDVFGDVPADAVSCEEPGKSTGSDDQEIQE